MRYSVVKKKRLKLNTIGYDYNVVDSRVAYDIW